MKSKDLLILKVISLLSTNLIQAAAKHLLPIEYYQLQVTVSKKKIKKLNPS